MNRRGDVIIVEFPFTDAGQSKVRPALIMQNDLDNQRIRKTVIARVTGNLRRRADPNHVYMDPSHTDGASSGLSFPSLVSRNHLFTIDQNSIRQNIGHLSAALKQRLNDALKAALDLP